ncbi:MULTISPECIES: tetratricopeptide repeat protein [Parachlamydia]|uniref:tetratricopeptide repeat protein n=1 Tax=Parachlamydia TaxID=83551 RepID=UPI00030F0D39|nr:hypothetical protein [Parachlamydia acanthamoebae]
MHRFRLPVVLCAFSCMCFFEKGFSQSDIESAICEKNYKKAILLYQDLLEKSSSEKRLDILRDLAIAYWKDQEAEKAFKVFLDGVELRPVQAMLTEMHVDEKVVYEQALSDYLNLQETPQKIAVKILEKYEPILTQHPDYHHLGYLVAAAYANQGNFERFFCVFLSSYCADPSHFMAYKTKALLHIKLFERARTTEEHKIQRKQILEQLRLATEAYPQDHTIYKMLLLFTPESELPQMLDRYLNKIIDINMIIPRMDIAFYMQHILATGQVELGNRFLDKASEWYTQSKVIDEFRKRLKSWNHND